MRRKIVGLAVLAVMVATGMPATPMPYRTTAEPQTVVSLQTPENLQRPDHFWRSPDRIYEEQWFKQKAEKDKEREILNQLWEAESVEEKRRLLRALPRFTSEYLMTQALVAVKEHPDLILLALEKLPGEIEGSLDLGQFFSGRFSEWSSQATVIVLIPMPVVLRLAEKLSIRGAWIGVDFWRNLKTRNDFSREDRLRIWQMLLSRAATPGIKFVMELASIQGDREAQRRHIARYRGTLDSGEFEAALSLFFVDKKVEERDGEYTSIRTILVLADREAAEMLLGRAPVLEANKVYGLLTRDYYDFSQYPEFRRLVLERVPEIKEQNLVVSNYSSIFREHDDLWQLFQKKTKDLRFSSIWRYRQLLSYLGGNAAPRAKERARRFFADHADPETAFVFSLQALQTNQEMLLERIRSYQGTVEDNDNIIEAISAVRRYPKALELLDKKLGIRPYRRQYESSSRGYWRSRDTCYDVYDPRYDLRQLLWTRITETRKEKDGTYTTIYREVPTPYIFESVSLWLRHVSFYDTQQWAGVYYETRVGPDIDTTLCLLAEIDAGNRGAKQKTLELVPAVLALFDPEERIRYWPTAEAFEALLPNQPLIRSFLERHMSEEVQISHQYRSLKTLEERKAFLRALGAKNYRFLDGNADALLPPFDYYGSPPKFTYEVDAELVRLLLALLDKDSIHALSKMLTVHLNTLHDLGKLREQEAIASSLPPSSWYYMISQGQEVYTSTFALLYGKLVRYLAVEGMTLRQFVSQVDSEGNFSARFLLTVSYFDRLGELMATKEDANFWTELFVKLLAKDASDDALPERGLYLMPTLEKIFQGRNEALRIRFEEALLELYEATPESKKTQVLRRTLEIIFFKLQDTFSRQNRPKLKQILAEVDFLSPKQWHIPYQEWTRKTKALSVFSNWHLQETGHLANFISLAQAQGYRVESRRTIPAEKTRSGRPETEIILEKDINVPTSPFNKVRLINRLSSRPDIKVVMEDPTIQIVAHRGHSYQLMDTFYNQATMPFMKMLFIGSCGGFRSIPELARKYGGKNLQFLASLAVTEGAINNPLFLYTIDQIAFGRSKQWQDIQTHLPAFLKDKEKARAFVWPGELPMLLLFAQSR